MTYTKTESTDYPSLVQLEHLPEGGTIARLAKDVEEQDREDGKVFVFNEAVFLMPRDITVSEIKEDFDAWWAYGTADHSTPSLDERVDALEDAFLAMLG